MEAREVPLKVTAARFVHSVAALAGSEVGRTATFLFAALVALLCVTTGLNVLNSFVGRNFMSAIANRSEQEFIRQAVFYLGVFAASTFVTVIARFAEERLGLLWRGWLTRRAVRLYLANATYDRLTATDELANPDQRIAEDVKAFTGTTLSFVLMLLNSVLTIVAFSDVLWTISPALFFVAVLYAVIGSYMMIRLGRPLVRLNYDQLDKEAGFRSALIHVRQNAEAIRLSRSEAALSRSLLDRLGALVA
ncbi:MAG: ABC transporter ATP-binding protein/permease, partial [Hyphomicrobiales bacterium]|nr:ABC transporter ATP-binding protein/permease [Hyphomicrobiales bacterium]